MIELQHAMIYRLEVAGPVESSDGSPANPRTPYPDGYGRPHVRLAFHTNDGATVLLEYSGIVQASAAFLKAVEQNVRPNGRISICAWH